MGRLHGMAPNSPRIMVIDDDDPLRDAVELALCRAGYAVCAKPDGLTLHSDLAGFRPDLAVLEVQLSEGPSGLCLARMLRDDDELPIMLVSTRYSLMDRIAGYEAGADDYVAKPFDMRELLVRIRALLRRSGKLTARTWQVGDLVVDEVGRIAYRNGVEVELTRTEFDLLVELGHHPYRVLSKTRLLASVWGCEQYDHNVVEARVSGLRRKLERHGPRLIHTERGVGYRLRPPVKPGQ
jgi:two-component system, OmpR family, response regulator